MDVSGLPGGSRIQRFLGAYRLREQDVAKKTAVTKKSGKSPSGAKKTKGVAKKPSAKATARKPQGKTSARSSAKKTTKPAVTKSASKSSPKAAGFSAKMKIAPAAHILDKKIKTPLSKKQLQEFRELLLTKRKSLLGDMTGIQSTTIGRNLQESSGDLSNMPTHQADIGSDNFEYEFTLGLLESERSLLREVNEALERIEDGTYGVCLGTGEPIGIPRLKARPWCKYCIEFQKMVEKGLVRPGQSESRGESSEDEENESESEAETETETDVEAENVEEVQEEED